MNKQKYHDSPIDLSLKGIMSKRKATRELQPKVSKNTSDEKMEKSYCDFLNFLRLNFKSLLDPLCSLVSEYCIGYCPNRKYDNDDCFCIKRLKTIDKEVYITHHQVNSRFLNWNPTKLTITNKTTNASVECDVKTIERWTQHVNGIDECLTSLEFNNDDFGTGLNPERLKNSHLQNFFVSELTFQQIENAEEKREQARIDNNSDESQDVVCDYQDEDIDMTNHKEEPELVLCVDWWFHFLINKSSAELQADLGWVDENTCTLKSDVDGKIKSWEMEMYWTDENEDAVLIIQLESSCEMCQ
jgi:hypothetical protein